MTELFTIIATAGAVANIIDVLSSAITAIHELRTRWRDSDIAFLGLVSQLSALKAALTKIKEWTDTNPAEQHHQLVMDLNGSISCCRMLICKVDTQLSELRQDTDETLDLASKVKFVIGNRGMDDLQKMIGHQVNALTLLLTACNSQAISEQKFLLEKSSTRKAFRRVEKDTGSLFVHRDTASLFSRYSDNLSKLSISFEFDHELFVSKIYGRVFRGSVKESLQRQQGITNLVQVDKRTQAINCKLEEDARSVRRECLILLLGTYGSGKDEIMRQMKITHQNPSTLEERALYRPTIYTNIIDSAKTLILAMEQFQIQLENEVNRKHCDFLMDYTFDPDPEKPLETSVWQALDSLWHDPSIQSLMERRDEFYLMDSAPYFFDEIKRISNSGYVPCEADIIRARTCTSPGVYEHRFTIGRLSLKIIDIGDQRLERTKRIHQFDSITAIMFVVDLGSYNQVLLAEASPNRIMESLILFDSVVNSPKFRNASVILLLSNVGPFKTKLSQDPLSNYFPDYSGGNDVNRAAKYILWRFKQANRAHLKLYPHLVKANDPTNISLAFAAIRDITLQNTFYREGIF